MFNKDKLFWYDWSRQAIWQRSSPFFIEFVWKFYLSSLFKILIALDNVFQGIFLFRARGAFFFISSHKPLSGRDCIEIYLAVLLVFIGKIDASRAIYMCPIINHSHIFKLAQMIPSTKKSALNSCCFHMNICIIVQRWVFDVRDLRNLTLKVSTRCEAASCKDSSEVRLQGIAVEAHLFAAGLISDRYLSVCLCTSWYPSSCLRASRWTDGTGRVSVHGDWQQHGSSEHAQRR